MAFRFRFLVYFEDLQFSVMISITLIFFIILKGHFSTMKITDSIEYHAGVFNSIRYCLEGEGLQLPLHYFRAFLLYNQFLSDQSSLRCFRLYCSRFVCVQLSWGRIFYEIIQLQRKHLLMVMCHVLWFLQYRCLCPHFCALQTIILFKSKTHQLSKWRFFDTILIQGSKQTNSSSLR